MASRSTVLGMLAGGNVPSLSNARMWSMRS
jgi:hypothetical protein